MSETTNTSGESGGAGRSAEFEREPVAPSALLGFRNFLGVYAGENIAGTELMIGPLFVAAGVSAFDLILGLLVGNVLAVASWMAMTAPIAVRARLTLYYHLERICGRRLVTLYNLSNGLMFCFLAGAMITISATAVGVMVKFPMPALSDTLPNSWSWCAAVLAVGFIIAAVAAKGYRFVAWVADLAAPWMVFVFLGFGIVGLKEFLSATGLPFKTASDAWHLFSGVIWTGGDPLPGQIKFTIWHVIFFAWFCNMAVHVGMSDLSLLRFARKSWYSVAAAAGMYLGHFMAWICAAVLYALQLHVDKTNVTPLPGPMAATACGLAGLVCVVIAGWTTANPTIYRAGLAFQAVMPRASRVKVTFVTGMLAAVAGMFPAVTMKLLDFVALYGLLLMPMGAVLFMDFWVLPRLGLRAMLAAETGIAWNAAAAWSWFGTLAACLLLVKFAGIPIFFVGLPGWFIASATYVAFSKYQPLVSKRFATVVRSICLLLVFLALIGLLAAIALNFRWKSFRIIFSALDSLASLIFFVCVPIFAVCLLCRLSNSTLSPLFNRLQQLTSGLWQPNPMIRHLCFVISYVALAGVLLAPLLYFWDVLDKPAMKTVMTVTTLVWFVCGGIVRARELRSGS